MANGITRSKLVAALTMLLLLGASGVHAQFIDRFTNPRIDIPITHAPRFPLALKLSRVAFDNPQGPCSEELYDTIESSFVEHDIEVLNRSHLDDVLREQGFGVSGLTRQDTAVKVGQLLGAQALVFLKVTTCKAKPTVAKKQVFSMSGPVTVVEYTTTADFRGSLRVIDLTTGRTLKIQSFDGTASESSRDGYPDGDALLEAAREKATGQIRRLFFPWTESRQVVFYEDNDKFCNLEPGYNLLKAHDLNGALEASRVSYDHCRNAPGAKPKMVGRAAYDVGVALCLRGDYDEGLTMLTEALRLNPGDVATNAMAECRQAKQAANQMDIYETDIAAVQADLSDLGGPGTHGGAEPARGGAAGSSASRPAQGSVEDRLRALQDLLKKGLIDEKEFQGRKAEILKDL